MNFNLGHVKVLRAEGWNAILKFVTLDEHDGY